MKRVAEKSKTYSGLDHSADSSNTAVSPYFNTVKDTGTTPAIVFKRQLQSAQLFDRITMSRSLLPSRHEACVWYTMENLCHRSGPLAKMYLNVLPCKVPVLIHNQEAVMHDCLSTLASLYYSTQKREKGMMIDAIRLYGRGLRRLNDTLSRESCVITTEIVVSVLCLSISEVCIFLK